MSDHKRFSRAPALVHIVKFRARDLIGVFRRGRRVFNHTMELDPDYKPGTGARP